MFITQFYPEEEEYEAEANLLKLDEVDPKSGRVVPGTINVKLFESFKVVGRLVLKERIRIEEIGKTDSLTIWEIFQNLKGTKPIHQILSELDGMTRFEETNGGVVTIFVESTNDSLAAGLANAYINAYFAYHEEEQEKIIQRELDFVDLRLQEIEHDLPGVKDSLFDEELEFVNRRIEELGKEVRTAEDSLYAFKRRHAQLPKDSVEFDKLARDVSWIRQLLDTRTAVYRSLLNQREQVRLKQQHLQLPKGPQRITGTFL